MSSKPLIWDVPTRVLHGLLVGGFALAFGLAMLAGRDGPGFAAHMVIGLCVGLVVVLRLLWAVVGTRHARFAEFAYGPTAVIGYLRAVAAGKDAAYAGHNPASAWVGLILLILAAGTTASGLAMGRGVESAEELHNVLAWAMLVLGALHMAGVVIHNRRHRDHISRSMLTGTKVGDPSEGIPRGYFWVGIGMLAIVIGFGGSLWRDYNPLTGETRWPIVGGRLLLGHADDNHGNRLEPRPPRAWTNPARPGPRND